MRLGSKSMTEIESVWDYASSIFKCGKYSIHGPEHWKRVEENGILIAEQNDADVVVVRLFAALHDCCRRNDGSDLEHGPRAADMIYNLRGKLFNVNKVQFEQLSFAIRNHTEGTLSDDPAIGTCWDSDRLDIGRVGKYPSKKYMSTVPGKEILKLKSKYIY